MRIAKVEIGNYRNLDGVSVSFDENCNFIVGENNIGKSNLLNMFRILFSNKSFDLSDFADPTNPVEVKIRLRLEDLEIGHFEDLFDLENYSFINIVGRQLSPNDNIEFHHLETDTFIPAYIVRGINYIHYDSLRNPISEINLDKRKGVGKFLVKVISQYLEDDESGDQKFLNDEEISLLLKEINLKISKLKSFTDFKISADHEEDLCSLLSRIIVFRDDRGNLLSKSGYGVQFLILIILSILDKIQGIKEQRRKAGIFEKSNKNYMSLLIGLDEPEIHLHPYMQRSLIKYLNNVILNSDSDFQGLVKDLFDVDGFIGQIIVVTHSPNILLNDYRQIIRFYREADVIKVKSGSEIVLNEQHAKHLHMRFPYFKEAFFSRCVIFVEGESEEASFPCFANTMSLDLDSYGISIIQSHGGALNAINILIELAQKFNICSVGIADKDDNLPVSPPVYLTDKRDFDEEIVSSLFDVGKENILEEIIKEFNNGNVNITLQSGILNKCAVNTYKIITSNFTSNLTFANAKLSGGVQLKAFYLTWFASRKSYPLGKIIGEKIGSQEIPTIYQTVIREAVKISEL
mgnify:CR=1 FL=1